MSDESLVTIMYVSATCGLLGLTLPWLALLAGRTAAAVSAVVLAAAGTVAFLISNAYMPEKYNIRVDLVILPPLLVAAWAVCIVLTVLALRRRKLRPTTHS
jgi:hypothetical protein